MPSQTLAPIDLPLFHHASRHVGWCVSMRRRYLLQRARVRWWSAPRNRNFRCWRVTAARGRGCRGGKVGTGGLARTTRRRRKLAPSCLTNAGRRIWIALVRACAPLAQILLRLAHPFSREGRVASPDATQCQQTARGGLSGGYRFVGRHFISFYYIYFESQIF